MSLLLTPAKNHSNETKASTVPLIHEAIEKAREGGEGIFSGELLFCLTRVGFHCVFLEGNKNKLWKSVGGGMPSIYLVYGSDRRLHSYCVCLSATVGTNAGQRLNQLHLPPPALHYVSL